MENTEKYEIRLVHELYNQLVGRLEHGSVGSFIYEMCYLRYLSLRAFKDIVHINNLSLEAFIEKYNSLLDSVVKEDMMLQIANEDSKNVINFEEYINCAKEVLIDIERFRYSLTDISKIISLLCSYNDVAVKNIMLRDLNETNRFSFQTPDQICKIINSVLDIDKNDTVLDICSSYGNYLVNVSNCCEYSSLSGIEIMQSSVLISKLRLLVLTGTANITTGNVLELQLNNKYDKVLCNYPWGYRIEKHNLDYINQNLKSMKFNWEISSGNVDWMFINILLSSLKENGRGATIMPLGPLFKKPDEVYRKDLIDGGYIEAIIKLPVVTHYTSIDQYLIVFSKNNKRVKFVDISAQVVKKLSNFNVNMSKIFEILDSDNNEFVKYVNNEKIAENSYLLKVENYIGKKEVKYHNPHLLSDYVLDIFRGYQMTSKEQDELESPTGNYEILMISDIEDGIISSNLKKIDGKENKYDRYLVQDKDLIISSKGTRIKIAVADNIGDRKIIANGNLIVLRVNQKELNPYYLEAYLNSSDGQTILNQIQTGSVIISINPSNLLNIKISMLPLEQQEKIGNKYLSQKKMIEMTKERLKELEKSQETFFDDVVWDNIMKG